MISRIGVPLGIVVGLLLSVPSVRGCSCARVTPCEAFGNASAVFVARMLEGTEKKGEYNKDGKSISLEAGKVRFAVEDSFKGVTATEITVTVINMNGTSCQDMVSFVRGERYLVYAGYHESVGLALGPCARIKSTEEAKEDFEFLRNLKQPGSGGRLFGTVEVESGGRGTTPLPDIEIVIEDEAHQIFRTKTDRSGKYEINALKPGNYKVKPLLAKTHIFRDKHQDNREIHVEDRGCARAGFWVMVSGRVAGRVRDSTGQPAPADLRLVSIGESQRMLFGYTDEDGDYEIEGVAPGEYLLQIELTSDGKESPYFYPGTADRTKAKTLTFSTAQQLAGYDFDLPQPIQTITVRGTVSYSDGRAAANVEVRLILERSEKKGRRASDGDTTVTDGAGRFALHGYRGVTYTILALDDHVKAIEEKRYPWGRAQTAAMTLTEEVNDIKVVLSLEAKKPMEDASKPGKKP